MKANYDHQPATFEPVGNGTFRYRFNIVEEISEDGKLNFSCEEVTISEIEENEITRAVIAEIWKPDYEQKMINDFYSAQAGILPDEAKQPYLAFLIARKQIKEQIKVDYLAWLS